MHENLELLKLSLGKDKDAIGLLDQFGLVRNSENGLAALVRKWEDEEKSVPEDGGSEK